MLLNIPSNAKIWMFNPHSTKYFIITISITIIVGIDILPTYMAVYHMCAVHKVAKRGDQTSWS